MKTEQDKEYTEWKKRFPLLKRIIYWLVGYPPYYAPISDEAWKKWESRF